MVNEAADRSHVSSSAYRSINIPEYKLCRFYWKNSALYPGRPSPEPKHCPGSGMKLKCALNRSYACGIVSGSKNMMLFRSATLGYIDLSEPDTGVRNFGGIRPGCWINALPVGGLVIMPDATDRCNCSYLNKATIALRPL